MQIRIQHADGREECVTLDVSQTLRFGSRRSADVVLQGEGVFPIHFGILWHREAFTAVPSQLARKIRVNGSRVRKAVLRDGDRIEVGGTVLTVLDTDVVTIRTETPARDSREAYLRLVQSVWFARVLWACAVLPLVALIGVYVGQRPTADELFRSADAVFRQEDFARSMEVFGQFLRRHPHHALANEAGMKRDLAQLLDRFDHGMDAALLLSEIKAVTGRWNDDEQHHPDAQHGLSQMLPALVQDLTRVAQIGGPTRQFANGFRRPGSCRRRSGHDARVLAASAAASLQRRPIAGSSVLSWNATASRRPCWMRRSGRSNRRTRPAIWSRPSMPKRTAAGVSAVGQ